MNRMAGSMDRQWICSSWEPAKCAIEFIWEGYALGSMHVIDTDYENYEIRFSKANFAGVDYMEAVWVGARKPLRMGSSDYQEWYDLVE